MKNTPKPGDFFYLGEYRRLTLPKKVGFPFEKTVYDTVFTQKHYINGALPNTYGHNSQSANLKKEAEFLGGLPIDYKTYNWFDFN